MNLRKLKEKMALSHAVLDRFGKDFTDNPVTALFITLESNEIALHAAIVREIKYVLGLADSGHSEEYIKEAVLDSLVGSAMTMSGDLGQVQKYSTFYRCSAAGFVYDLLTEAD